MRETVKAAKKALEHIGAEKRFPIQGGLSISWEAAERAYDHYVKRYGSVQTLQRLAERGGFGVREFVELWYVQKGLASLETQFAMALAKADVRAR
jgi:hypothetical protein